MLIKLELDISLIKKEIDMIKEFLTNDEDSELKGYCNKLRRTRDISDIVDNVIYDGVYETTMLSDILENYTKMNFKMFKSFYNFKKYDFRENYGIVDSLEQIFEIYPELKEPKRKFVMEVNEVRREDQEPNGGFRYHKNGVYYGKQNPEHEYLYDDIHIEKIILYHIYEIE